MRALSPETRALLEELGEAPGARLLAGRRDRRRAELLDRCAARGEPAALPRILSHVLARQAVVAEAAVDAVAALLARVPVRSLPRLDLALRERATWWGGWWGMEPRELGRLERFGPRLTPLLQLASCHPNGHVREAAVARLAARAPAASIGFFLLRCNDWVPQLRAAAEAALAGCPVDEQAPDWVACLPLLAWLRACGRADHAARVEAVEAALATEACAPALEAGLGAPERDVRRACFRLASASPAFGRDRLLGRAFADPDPVVRIGAARVAVAGDARTVAPWLERMESDGCGAVRQLGLQARVAHFPGQARAARERHLLDRSASIRADCQRALRAEGARPVEHYRRHLAGPGPPGEPALLGLAETGAAEDAELARGFLAHPRPRIRAAALRAWSRLADGELAPSLRAGLADPSPRVSRAARVATLTRRLSLGAEPLWALFQGEAPRHVRRNVVVAARTLGRWPCLDLLLRACAEADEHSLPPIHADLERWLRGSNRAALSPTADEVAHTTGLLTRAVACLPTETASELRFLLRTLEASG